MSDNFINKFSVKILDSLPEGVYVINKEFQITFINKAAEEITGISKENVIGKICRSFCRSERCIIGCPVTEVIKTERNIVDLESSIQDINGNLIPIKLNVSILKDDNNNPIGGIISFKKNTNINFEEYLKGSDNFYGIVGKSKPMKELFKSIEEISRSDANVLITGETGVGKELVANAIKETSKRRDKNICKS